MNSIIIPHRNRNAYLDLCLWSIMRSYRATGADCEVIIVDDGSREPICVRYGLPRVTVLSFGTRIPRFNKPFLLNRGIEAAQGDVLTFLDADAVVGKYWLASAKALEHDSDPPTRLCYRVRYLEADALELLQDAATREALVARYFAQYDAYPKGYEAYGKPDHLVLDDDLAATMQPVFGNSQFSMRRDTLGDLRFDERYDGRGHEDLSFIATVHRAAGDAYRGVIVTTPEHAMFHVKHPYEPEWLDPDVGQRNRRMFYAGKA